MNANIRVKVLGSMALAMATLLTAFPVVAQEASQETNSSSGRRILSMSQQAQDYTVLYVDAATGSDQQASGSVDQPYKTITRALEMAPTTSTVILLSPGHYSQASGENFPLQLRPGITIQGNAGETRNTLIVGSGEFRGGSHNATIVTADRSGLANVTISNPKGNGVWIASGTPVLRRLALVSNAAAGVQVTDGAPMIENSYFNHNQIGLEIQGRSQAIVRGNYFEATGRAITIASPAMPIINNNRIARNDVGIALKNNARPVLEANVLNDNGRNGVVEVDSTVAVEPTLPDTEPLVVRVSDVSDESELFDGAQHEEIRVISPDISDEELVDENELVRETRVAVNLSSSDADDTTNLAPAPVPDPLSGQVEDERKHVFIEDVVESDMDETVLDLQREAEEPGSDEIVESERAQSESVAAIEHPGENEEAEGSLLSFRQHLAGSAAPNSVHADEQPPILQRRQATLPVPNQEEGSLSDAPLTEDAIAIAVIPANRSEPGTGDQGSSLRREGISKLLSRLNQSSAPPAVPVSVPASVSESTDDASGQRLPVPSAAIPSSGGEGNLTPPSGTVSVARVFRYQVLVDIADAGDLQVLVPDAFRTKVGHRMFMQAGAYVDEDEAQERLEWLRENGIEARVNLRE